MKISFVSELWTDFFSFCGNQYWQTLSIEYNLYWTQIIILRIHQLSRIVTDPCSTFCGPPLTQILKKDLEYKQWIPIDLFTPRLKFCLPAFFVLRIRTENPVGPIIQQSSNFTSETQIPIYNILICENIKFKLNPLNFKNIVLHRESNKNIT